MRNKNAKVIDPNSIYSCPGEEFHIEYSPKVMPDGTIQLVESGKTDINEYINSFAEQCDMQLILKKLALGDTSVLSSKTPFYGDFTEAPKSYAEALQLIIDAEKEFYKLPLDKRNEFDNDYHQWFAQAGSEEWFKKMGFTDNVASDSELVGEEKS